MKKRESKPEKGLITVEDFAKTYTGWRGKPVTTAYIYKLIKQNREQGKILPFDWVEDGKKLWIKQ